jgi:hypothetical protein
MPFGPVTLIILLAQEFFFGSTNGWPSFQALSVTLASQLSNFWVLFWNSYSKYSQWEHCIQYTSIKCSQVHTKKNYMYVIITIDPVTLNLHDPFITPPRKNGFNFRSMLFHTDFMSYSNDNYSLSDWTSTCANFFIYDYHVNLLSATLIMFIMLNCCQWL